MGGFFIRPGRARVPYSTAKGIAGKVDCEMSDQIEQGDKSGEAGKGPADGGGANARSFTESELNQMFAERARRAETSLLKKLGFERADDATAALGRLKAMEDGQKTEAQKMQERIAELTQANSELSGRQRDQVAQYEVMIAAGRLGVVDADAAFRLLDKSKLEFDKASGKPTNVEGLLKALLVEKPWLAGTGTSASNRARNHDETNDPIVAAFRRGAGLKEK